MNSQNYDELFQGGDNEHSCIGKPKCAFTHHLEALRKVPPFSGAPLEMLKLFAYMSRSAEYEKGELILKQGDRADAAYFIMEGEVEAYQDILGKKGETLLFQRMSAHDCFGELALLADFECFVNLRALSKVKLLTLDRRSFQKTVSKFEEKRNEIMEKIVQLGMKRFEKHMALVIEQLKRETRIS